jgi:hypothetical protein
MSRLSAHLDEAAAHRRRWGWRRTLYRELMLALHRLFDLRLFVLHVRSQAADPPEVPLPPGRRVRLLERDDLVRASVDPRLDMPPRFVEEALGRGDLGVGVFEGERLISYLFRAFAATPAGEGVWIRFEPPYRYGYRGFTLPEHRGEHLQDALAYYTDRLCIERGRTHGLSLIETHNFPSLAADRRRGNVPVGHAACFRIGPRWFIWNSPGARRHRIRLVRAAGVH